MNGPALIMVAPNGARRNKADHPQLPISPAELANAAAACLEAGAALIHLHVRDAAGGHSLDPDAYRAAIAAIRVAVGERMIVQATTEAVGRYRPEQQMAMVRDLRPEAVSLAIAELMPDEAALTDAADFLDWLARECIFPQYILYSAAEVERFKALRRRGVIPGDRVFALYVLGRYTAGQQSDPLDLLPFISAASGDHAWSVCAFGAGEAAAATAALALGGHVRVGFENNLCLPDGRLAVDNADPVGRAVRAADLIGRPVMTAAEARRFFAGA
ncbi:MAG: 3-keto-5-aminohexanoate cleavage protein [Azospirillum sp.]|nr:3-keto-5-aminohexanoate cleavage protein [Azospirillum sp.]